MKIRITLILAFLMFVGALNPRETQAGPIVGAQLFATGGEVTATFVGHSAAYTNDLLLFDASNLTTPLGSVLFTNQTTLPGTTVNLGTFAAGTELVFGIYVRDTGNTFFMGPGSRNADGIEHGAVDDGLSPAFPSYGSIPPGMIGVGFEDIFGGGDFDYDDMGFAFGNVNVRPTPETAPVPEPGSLLLMGTGLAGLWRRCRRGKAIKPIG